MATESITFRSVALHVKCTLRADACAEELHLLGHESFPYFVEAFSDSGREAASHDSNTKLRMSSLSKQLRRTKMQSSTNHDSTPSRKSLLCQSLLFCPVLSFLSRSQTLLKAVTILRTLAASVSEEPAKAWVLSFTPETDSAVPGARHAKSHLANFGWA